MSALSRDQFIAGLKKSRAMDEEAVDSWMSRVDDKDPKTLATKLVRDKMLTQWQAKFLLTGRSRLSVGNYLLLTRISRDELGDRFEAIHSQLGRKVVIQIFPSSIDKNKELRARVLKAMQQMTELDHLCLVHVYDVDQEGDRYFVVTEFVDSTALSKLPRGDLKDSDVASIIADLITGIRYAHQEGVIHGDIRQENVLVTAESRGKLQGLPTSAVRCEMSDSSGKLSHQQDFNAISQLGCSVLQEVPPKRRGEGYDQLVKIVGALSSAEGSDLDQLQLKLAQWLAKHEPKPVAALGEAGTESPSEANDLASVQSGNEQDSELSVTAPTKRAEPKQEAEPVGFLSKMWNEKRALSLAAIAATLLTLVGGVGAAGYLLAQPSATADGNSVVNNDRNRQNPAAAENNGTPKGFKLENPAEGEGLLSAARTKDALDPEATKRKFEEMYAQRNPAENENTTTSAVASKPDAVDVDETEPEVAAAVTPDPVEVVAAAPAVVEPEETKAEVIAEPAAKPKASKKKTPTNPFADLPKNVDLPLSTETSDVTIAEVEIDKRYLMGLELLSGPEVSKYKHVFDMKRSTTDKQLWDVRLQRRKNDDPLPVAQFQKTASELIFRWLPAAEELDEANYVRNCKIKLTNAKDIGWIGLRKPVDIQNFAFASGKTSIKEDVDLKWLPNPKGLQVELDPFKVEEADGETEKGKVIFAPREISKKAPGVIFFRDKDDLRFFFVEVGVELRSKLKMQAQMFALGADGTPRPLRKQADLLKLADALAVRQADAESFLATIEQAGSKKGIMKILPQLKNEGGFDEIFGKAKKATKLATRQLEACGDYVKIAENLGGRKIPFQVFFNMDGHRIKLAESIADQLPEETKK